MKLDNLTSLDIALICEGLIHLIEEQHTYGDRPILTWSKIAMQAFGFSPDETMDDVRQLRERLALRENPDLSNLAEGLDTSEMLD